MYGLLPRGARPRKTAGNEILIVEKLVVARVAGVTAGLAESNGSLQSGLWLTSPAGWLPRTGMTSGTLCSVIASMWFTERFIGGYGKKTATGSCLKWRIAQLCSSSRADAAVQVNVNKAFARRASDNYCNRKSHVSYWMALISVILSDLECHFSCFKPL